MKGIKEQWLEKIGNPENYEFEHSLRPVQKFQGDCFDGELYEQANGPGTFQRVMMLFRRNIRGSCPGSWFLFIIRKPCWDMIRLPGKIYRNIIRKLL